ncbi:hypothetical protein [Bradyrhizobium sp. Leo121]|uniref:hypothetical protein n=1 Tax=Bradyrhizobium sp. Leo121 TaxID=1571195 RepID=UPI0010296FF2|nr:hypothetical protein [Bradyrhizobium sp. Leo121]RZN35509.1 hypothetical protein CWO90_03170 [Bradyrhizobium sp. Leo121]
MAKKPPKETPHLRVRIDPKLLAKLEKSREKNDHTLTGEIVARLEQSFQTDERIADFREAMEKRVEDHRRRYDEQIAALRKESEEATAICEKALKDTEQQYAAALREIDRKGAEFMPAAAVVDVLLGGSRLKSDFFRSLALELADVPEELLADELNRRQLIERAIAAMERRTGVAAQ